jgi:hypothetical protein
MVKVLVMAMVGVRVGVTVLVFVGVNEGEHILFMFTVATTVGERK